MHDKFIFMDTIIQNNELHVLDYHSAFNNSPFHVGNHNEKQRQYNLEQNTFANPVSESQQINSKISALQSDLSSTWSAGDREISVGEQFRQLMLLWHILI